jgi:hypothetical protein
MQEVFGGVSVASIYPYTFLIWIAGFRESQWRRKAVRQSLPPWLPSVKKMLLPRTCPKITQVVTHLLARRDIAIMIGASTVYSGPANGLTVLCRNRTTVWPASSC